MNERCQGLNFNDPKQEIKLNKLTDMFVDDLNQFCNTCPPESTIVDQTRHNVQLHSDLVFTSGGILALDKCKYYHIDFHFDDDGVSHMFTKDELPSQMQIQSALDKVMIEIEHICAHSPHETLGYVMKPSGKDQELFQIVEGHVNEWITNIQSSKLFPHEKIMSYHTVLVPQVVYRLVGASFSYEQCDKLMQRIYPILINAHGFHRSFSRAMASAPYTYAGLNITHFFDLQGQYKLKFFLLHMKRNDSTGKLFKIALRYMQQSTGLSTPFYNKKFDSYGHLLPHSWLRQLFQYLDSRQVKIELTEDITLPQARRHDVSIMELLSKHFTKNQLCIINRYRIFLQVMFISEVTDINGKHLLPNIKEGKNFRDSKWTWPNQTCPKGHEKLWKRACHVLQTHLSTNRLGSWKKKTQEWQWKTNHNSSYIIHPNLGCFKLFQARYRSYYIKSNEDAGKCTFDADAHYNRDKLVLMSKDVKVIPAFVAPKDQFKFFFEDHKMPPAFERKILKLLKKNRLLYGSDATVNEGMGGFAWGILDKQNTSALLLKSHAPVHGTNEQTHSTRGELFGLLACLRHVAYLKEKYSVKFNKKIKIYVYTDSSSSISIAKTPFYLTSKTASDNDSDIKCEVRAFFKKLKNLVDVIHVKGHQDNETEFCKLPDNAKLNVLVDDFAKTASTDSSIRHKQIIPHLPRQQISLVTPFERITRNVDREIVRLKIGHEAERYLQRRWKLNDKLMSKVLWNDLRSVISKEPNYRKTQYAKILHKTWPTMMRNLEWKQSVTDLCPLCNKTPESRRHIFQCNDSLAVANRNQSLLNFRKTLSKANTNPLLTAHVVNFLRQFVQGFQTSKIKILETHTPIERDDLNSINALLDIGVDNIISGVVSSDATEIQQRFASTYNVGERFSILSWNRMLIRALLDFSNSIWKYRSGVLHETKEKTREAMIKEKAVELLITLRRDPYLLPYNARDLAHRKKSDIMEATLTNVRNWIARVNVALEDQTRRLKIGVTDIRDWLSRKSEIDEDEDDGFYFPGDENSEYDSDDTRAYVDNFPDEAVDTWDRVKCAMSCFETGGQNSETKKIEDGGFYFPGDENSEYDSDDTRAYVDEFPDEAVDTWDRVKCAITCLDIGGRMCEKTCLCLNDRFSVCTMMPARDNLYTSFTKPPHPL